MLPNYPVSRFMNYHLKVFGKRYYHLRVIFKIFALALFIRDWTLCQVTMGVPPGGLMAENFSLQLNLARDKVARLVSSAMAWLVSSRWNFPSGG